MIFIHFTILIFSMISFGLAFPAPVESCSGPLKILMVILGTAVHHRERFTQRAPQFAQAVSTRGGTVR
jgi:hypothetical protein